MNLYGNEPQERAMQSLIHDSNREFSSLNEIINKLNTCIAQIHKESKEKGINITSTPYILTEYLKSCRKNLMDAVDNYYKKFEQDFKEQ